MVKKQLKDLENKKIYGKEELTKIDKQNLKKNGFDPLGMKLFNFYRKGKALVNCRRCLQVLKKSVNQDGFIKTHPTKAKAYCIQHMCVVCKERIRKIKVKPQT